MGSTIIMDLMIVLVAITVIFSLILLLLLCKSLALTLCPSFFKAMVTKLLRKLMWNSVLRAILESYLATCIFVFVAASKFEAYTEEGRIEIVSTLATGIFYFAFPFKAWNFMFRNTREIRQPAMRMSYDSLYQNVETLKGPVALSMILLFCLRRLVFAYTTTMHGTIVFQVMINDFFSLGYLAYLLSVRPMVDSINNFIHIVNEVVVLVCIQMMFLYTEYVGDPALRYRFGFYFIYIVAADILVNLAVLIVVLCKDIYKVLRKAISKR